MGLRLALGLCWCLLGAAATEPHSLDILITGLNEPGGTHGFFMLAKLDGLELASYSSASREVKPLREWAAQAVGASYLRKKTQEFRLYEAISRVVTHRWMARHNQTGGIHTLQLHVNCVLDGDTPVRGQFHFAFDGQDFLILERNQSAWVPLAPGASNETHFWDAGHTWTLFAREFLQEECVDTLRSLLRGGTEALGRQVPPGISVTYRDAPHGSATLSCHARGFYPRPIRVSWVRDGAEILPPVNASGILPHADGTYQIRQSLEIPPRWGHSYACRVAHSSLGEPAPSTALPEVSVSRRDAPDGSATLSCRARGFGPRPVHVSWVGDGKQTPAPPIGDTSALQRSLGIPQQAGAGHSYSCRVQPHGLQEALATPVPGEMGGLAPGILAVLGLAALTGAGAALAGVVVWRRKRLDSGRSSYTPTVREDPGLDAAGQCQTTAVCWARRPVTSPPTAPASPDQLASQDPACVMGRAPGDPPPTAPASQDPAYVMGWVPGDPTHSPCHPGPHQPASDPTCVMGQAPSDSPPTAPAGPDQLASQDPTSQRQTPPV